MSRAKGDKAEEIALAFLQENNYSIIERNFYSRFGEIDIIALKEGVLRFVEVKSAKSYEKAVQNITPSKLRKFTQTIYVYLKKNSLDCEYEVDALIVVDEEITLLENITI